MGTDTPDLKVRPRGGWGVATLRTFIFYARSLPFTANTCNPSVIGVEVPQFCSCGFRNQIAGLKFKRCCHIGKQLGCFS